MSATTAPVQLRTSFVPVVTALGLGLAALLALFFLEGQAAVGVWLASTAYGHCFLIVPMALYLAWDRRRALAGIPARPTPVFALLALPVTAVWFLAERLGIMEGRQLAAIAAVEVLFLTVLGWRLFRALLAPLAFLVFLVPFGAFVTPWLQVVTARIAAIGLDLLGIPNYVTDLTIEISAGTFYVAEACAGLRFLIAAVAFGVFYALLNYRSPGRRVAFIAASIVVPIFANGLRALGIVVLGNILGSAEAAAADHILYGWIFFSIVILLLVLAGLPLRENPAGPTASARRPALGPSGASSLLACGAACVLAAVGPAAAAMLDRRATPPTLTALPSLAAPPGCTDGEVSAPDPVTRTQSFLCEGRQLVVTTQAFPSRSKSDSLTRERRRRTGEMEAEDVELGPLPGTAPGAGPWLLVRTFEPFRMSAVSSWADGAPTKGGLIGRASQARDSVLGSAYAPMLITATVMLPGRASAAEQVRIDALLKAFANAQDRLLTEMAVVSRTSP